MAIGKYRAYASRENHRMVKKMDSFVKFIVAPLVLAATFCENLSAATYNVPNSSLSLGKVSFPVTFNGTLYNQIYISDTYSDIISFTAPKSGTYEVSNGLTKLYGSSHNIKTIVYKSSVYEIASFTGSHSTLVTFVAGQVYSIKVFMLSPDYFTTTEYKYSICIKPMSSAPTDEQSMSATVAPSCKDMGKVSGGKTGKPGKTVTLKATANKGYVFAGWYKDAGFATPCDSTVTDYRNPSYAYTMGASDKMFYARFVPTASDMELALRVAGKAVPTTFTVSEYKQLALEVESLSLPKISVKGLPAGMKFTAKAIYRKGSKTEVETPANTIYGAPTKPGMYKVSVSISNTTVRKAIVKEFTIEVPNLTGANGYFAADIDNGIGKKCVLSVGISNIDDFLPSLKLNRNVKLAVSGLPAGLKYDAKTGKITGTATKAGVYTVTLTVTDGKEKYVSTITIEVEALPDWVVGTFEAYGYVIGTGDSGWYKWDWIDRQTITISSDGKFSGKGLWPSSWSGGVLVGKNSNGGYDFMLEYEDREQWRNLEFEVKRKIVGGVECGVISGISYGEDESDEPGDLPDYYEGEFRGIQNMWGVAKGSKLTPVFDSQSIVKVDMSNMGDRYYDGWESWCQYGGYLSLRFGNNGAVTTSYSYNLNGKETATTTVQLVPYDVKGDTVYAWLFTVLEPKDRDMFGALLFLKIDTSNRTVGGDDVYVEDYLLEIGE